jgi:hypothetical protein
MGSERDRLTREESQGCTQLPKQGGIVAEERSGERQQGAARRPPTTAGERPRTQEVQKSRPYAFYVVALALSLASTVFVLVMLIFQDVFKEAAVITTALSTLFGILAL